MEMFYIPLHLLALTYAVWNIVHADHMGIKWILGKVETLDAKKVAHYHKGTWLGLILAIVTGTIVFITTKETILYTQFYLKMEFVAALIINSFVIGKLSKIPTVKSFKSLTKKEKKMLFISGAISTISWLGAAITALFIVAE